jgi:hypothetical protein
MQISNGINRYDSTVQNHANISNNTPLQNTTSIKRFIEAFRVDISDRAKMNSEYNNPDISYPTYDSDVLQYSSNLRLTYKS